MEAIETKINEVKKNTNLTSKEKNRELARLRYHLRNHRLENSLRKLRELREKQLIKN